MDTKYLTLVRKTGGNFSLKNKYRNKVDLSAKNFTCILPETNMTMDKDGYIFICSCEGFLPYPVGHIFDFYRLHDIWNNPVAKKLQENTKAGSTFKFCDLKHCHGPFEEEDPFHDFTINITTDDSCNLQCPSCRNELMYYKSGKQFEKKKSYVKKFLELLDKYKGSVLIEFAGGEPFASKIYSEIIYNYKPNPKHRFTIRSNATLIDQSKFETSTMLKNNIQENRLLILATIARSGTHYMMILLSNYINYISGGNRSIGPSDMNKMLPNNWHLSYMSYRNIPFGPYHVNSIVTPDKRLKFIGLSDITRSHSTFQKVFWKNGNILHLYRNPLDYSVSLFNYKHKKRIGKKNPANSPQEVLNEKFANYVEMYKSYIEATNSGKYKIFRLPYELLIKDPEYYLNAVLTWLGIDPKKEIISRAVLTSSINLSAAPQHLAAIPNLSCLNHE